MTFSCSRSSWRKDYLEHIKIVTDRASPGLRLVHNKNQDIPPYSSPRCKMIILRYSFCRTHIPLYREWCGSLEEGVADGSIEEDM
ncbi:unnamed protein product [Spirodela intermedia]|uniref:Uncharacterized protein n=1 Tax=Spirodela intermedia TaxID=51605 RepID=A0A7I8LBN6_SPIIN|nr:unnamed protein product [Spirodela intermedia]